MADLPKPNFSNLPNQAAKLVHAHKAVSNAVKTHAQQHQDRTFKKRQAMATQQNLMKDIPPGGIQ